MSERVSLRERAETARARVRVEWDDARTAHLAERARARQRRRVIVRGSAASVVALTALALVGWMAGDLRTPASLDHGSPSVATSSGRPGAAPSGVLHLYDGSIATPIDDDTELVVSEVNEAAIVLDLHRGAARFEVTPGLPRAFRVNAGTVAVSVIGTVFTVRREGDGAAVEVHEGRVRVAWEPGRIAIVEAGEQGTFPRAIDTARASADAPIPEMDDESALEPTVAEDVPAIPSERPRRTARAETEHRRAAVREAIQRAAIEATRSDAEETVATRGWRALAERGLFDEGYGLLLADRGVLSSRDVEALMQAADVARLSGHPAESLAYLRRALEVGRGDPRAPMVAFTLGRVLLQQLGRPTDAADAFAQCRMLAPEGSLASDALAREVEAWHRAGEVERARGLALEYLRLHPQGLRASAVRHYGGLE